MEYNGTLRKMKNSYDEASGDVTYFLNLDEEAVCNLNEAIGKEVTLSFYCHDGNKAVLGHKNLLVGALRNVIANAQLLRV